MNQQKKKLLTLIANEIMKVKRARRREAYHHQYFLQQVNKHPYFLPLMLLPSFLVGWKSGKVARSGQILKHFAKYSFLTLLNLARSYIKLI